MLISIHHAGAGGGTMHALSFPTGTSTWTAPSGVRTLSSVSGYGANGSGPSQQLIVTVGAYSYNGAGPFPNAGFSGSMLTSAFNSMITQFVVGQLGPSNAKYSQAFDVDAATGNYQVFTSVGNFNTYTISQVGSTSISYVPSSSTVSSVGAGVWANTPGANGAASTAFGLSFVGGTPSTTPSLTSYNNVGVTPGTQYTIVNNSANPLIVVYYA